MTLICINGIVEKVDKRCMGGDCCKWIKGPLSYRNNLHVISPNATKYLTEFNKKILLSKTEAVVRKKVQDYKDGSGLQFIEFDFRDRRSRNQCFHSAETLSFLVVILSF